MYTPDTSKLLCYAGTTLTEVGREADLFAELHSAGALERKSKIEFAGNTFQLGDYVVRTGNHFINGNPQSKIIVEVRCTSLFFTDVFS